MWSHTHTHTLPEVTCDLNTRLFSHDQVHQWDPVFPSAGVTIRAGAKERFFFWELCTSNRALTFKRSLQRFVKTHLCAGSNNFASVFAQRFGKDQILTSWTESCWLSIIYLYLTGLTFLPPDRNMHVLVNNKTLKANYNLYFHLGTGFNPVSSVVMYSDVQIYDSQLVAKSCFKPSCSYSVLTNLYLLQVCINSCKTPSTLAHLHKTTLRLTPAEYSRKPQSDVEPPRGLTVVLSRYQCTDKAG